LAEEALQVIPAAPLTSMVIPFFYESLHHTHQFSF